MFLIVGSAGLQSVGLGRLSDRVAIQGAAIVEARGALERLADQGVENADSISALSLRVAELEARAASRVEISEVAADALAAVFTVEVRSSLGGGGLGSAWVAASGDGASTLVTNFHVVEDSWVVGGRDVIVRQDDLTYPGRIGAVSQAEDLAVIEVDVELPSLTITRTTPHVGDRLVVIGSPYGLEGTVTTGIVSAYRDGYLQFSAPVSPGNSGGPVLDGHGRVVAVTVAKVAAADAEGLSFAIPIATACRTVITC